MGFSQALLIPRSSGLPLAGRLLHVKASENVTQGGATGFTASDKCKLAGGSLPIGTQDFWVETWLYPIPSATYMTLMTTMAGAGGSGNTGFTLTLYVPTMQFVLTFEDSAGRILAFGFSGTLATNAVNHVVITFDRDGVAQCWLNGATSGTPIDISSNAGNLTTPQTTFGAAYDHSSAFDGALQCVRVGIGYLPTADEIADLYNNRNPLAYAELPGAIVAKLGDDGASWDLNESLIDPTHQAKDSHGTNHLTFTRDELATNGAMTTDTGWTKGTGWTVDADDSNTAASDGTQSADSDLEQACTLATGHAYDTSIVVTRTAGNVCVVVGGTEGTDRDSADTFAETITVGSSNNKLAVRADADFVGTVDTYSVKSARLYPVNGFQTAVASDGVGTLHGALTNYSTAEQATNWVAHGTGHALRGNGTNNSVVCGNAGNVTGISFSVRALAANQELFTLANSTATAVKVAAGELTFGASLTVSAITVDGETKTAAQAGALINDLAWHDVVLTLDSVAASNLILFTDSSAYGNVDLDDVTVSLSGAATHSYDFADGPSYTVSDGDPVLAIDSCEGNRRRFVQDNILKRPLWIANVFGDKPALRFDGVDDYLAYVGAALSGDVGTVVAFLQLSSAPNAAQTLLSQADTAGDTRFLGLYPRLNTATPNVQYSQNDAGTADTLTGDTEIAATTVYCLVWDTGGTGGIIRAFVNGVAQTLTAASGANNGDWWADLTGADVTALGALVRSAVTLCGAIDLAELIVYSRVLTPGELARVLRYGMTEYGVSP